MAFFFVPRKACNRPARQRQSLDDAGTGTRCRSRRQDGMPGREHSNSYPASGAALGPEMGPWNEDQK